MKSPDTLFKRRDAFDRIGNINTPSGGKGSLRILSGGNELTGRVGNDDKLSARYLTRLFRLGQPVKNGCSELRTHVRSCPEFVDLKGKFRDVTLSSADCRQKLNGLFPDLLNSFVGFAAKTEHFKPTFACCKGLHFLQCPRLIFDSL